jgi:hypothetical protein
VSKICDQDFKPCPNPVAGRGRGDSRCEQNGVCQRVRMDMLPIVRAHIQPDGSLSIKITKTV